VTLASQFLEHCDLAQLAVLLLRQLHAQFDEQVILDVFQGSHRHTIYQLQSSRPLTINPAPPGGGELHHCTSLGKLLLSSLDEPELEALIATRRLPAFTEHTITDPEDLRREIAQVRQAGYAVAREEQREGLIGVGAPVRDMSGRTVAGVAVGFPVVRTTPSREAAITRAVRRTAAEISLRLGDRSAARALRELPGDGESTAEGDLPLARLERAYAPS
jgi:DNA-binding IclR family transcriptional regulator